jgi:hypothetical protein
VHLRGLKIYLIFKKFVRRKKYSFGKKKLKALLRIQKWLKYTFGKSVKMKLLPKGKIDLKALFLKYNIKHAL